jgi:hypothetical protein
MFWDDSVDRRIESRARGLQSSRGSQGTTVIANVPTAKDFEEHALMFLNLAWDTIFDLLLEHSDAGQDFPGDDELSAEYWQAAKRPLSIAHALAQQGAEVALKSQIAATSPFLLICAPPSEWPRGCDKGNAAFADFRIVDAQELVRACNAVRDEVLPGEFVAAFDKFRKQRNALFHTVDERLDFSYEEIVRYVLHTAQLIAPAQWPQLRRTHLQEQPIYKAYAVDSVTNRLCLEMDHTISILGRADLLKWFGFDKNRRRYICPRCYYDCNRDWSPPHPTTAQLHPNTAASTNLHCFVCGSDITVLRRRCQQRDCKGNVINVDDDQECLTCFAAQDE